MFFVVVVLLVVVVFVVVVCFGCEVKFDVFDVCIVEV